MPENKLTPEQQRELWERCGFTIQVTPSEHHPGDEYWTWIDPEGRECDEDPPSTDPNNLLKYAWPMAVEKLKKIAPFQDNAARLFYFWRIKMAEGYSLEEALASMLYEVICDKMTVPKVVRNLLKES